MSQRCAALPRAILVLCLASPLVGQEGAARAISLEEAMRLAQHGSERIARARVAVERGEAEVRIARSEVFPQLVGSGSYTRTLESEFEALQNAGGAQPPPAGCQPFVPDSTLSIRERLRAVEMGLLCGPASSSFGGGIPFGQEHAYRIGGTLTYTVFAGGRIRARIAAAQARVERAELELLAARGQLLHEVALAYYDALLSEQLAVIADATLSHAETTLRVLNRGLAEGSQSEFDVLRARVARDNVAPPVHQRRAEREAAYLRLKELLDLPLDTRIDLTEDLGAGTLAPVAPVVERVLGAAPPEERVAALQADQDVHVREAQLREARATRYPQVTVSSDYSRVAYPRHAIPRDDFLTNWAVGVDVQWPIFTGGRRRGERMRAAAELRDALLRRDRVRGLARMEAREARVRLEFARSAWEATRATVAAAERAYSIAEVRFQQGASTLLEIADVRLLLHQARVNRAITARDLQVARARLALLHALPVTTLDRLGPDTPTEQASALVAPTPVPPPQPRSTVTPQGLQAQRP